MLPCQGVWNDLLVAYPSLLHQQQSKTSWRRGFSQLQGPPRERQAGKQAGGAEVEEAVYLQGLQVEAEDAAGEALAPGFRVPFAEVAVVRLGLDPVAGSDRDQQPLPRPRLEDKEGVLTSQRGQVRTLDIQDSGASRNAVRVVEEGDWI